MTSMPHVSATPAKFPASCDPSTSILPQARPNKDPLPNVSFSELLERIDALLQAEEGDIDAMNALLESYISKRSDWKKYCHFDPCRYTRNLVLEGNERFNLILLCWGEGQSSGIHDHAGADCFLKVLDGELLETKYTFPENEGDLPCVSEKAVAKTNDVRYMHDRLGLHRVGNVSHSKKAVSLHLYSPPFEECGCYCERTGICHTSRMTWHSKSGKRTDSCADIRSKMGLPPAK